MAWHTDGRCIVTKLEEPWRSIRSSILWAKETRAELVSLQAAGAVSKPGATPRELIEQIEGLLT